MTRLHTILCLEFRHTYRALLEIYSSYIFIYLFDDKTRAWAWLVKPKAIVVIPKISPFWGRVCVCVCVGGGGGGLYFTFFSSNTSKTSCKTACTFGVVVRGRTFLLYSVELHKPDLPHLG